jgi:hypothetical protein
MLLPTPGLQLSTGFNIGSNQTVTGLGGGNHAVTVSDIFGCVATSTAQLNNVVPLSFADSLHCSAYLLWWQ